jgi:hypothetical protein
MCESAVGFVTCWKAWHVPVHLLAIALVLSLPLVPGAAPAIGAVAMAAAARASPVSFQIIVISISFLSLDFFQGTVSLTAIWDRTLVDHRK